MTLMAIQQEHKNKRTHTQLTLMCEALIYPSGFVRFGVMHTRLSSYGKTSLKRLCSRLRSRVATRHSHFSRFLAICSNSANSWPSSLLSSACRCHQTSDIYLFTVRRSTSAMVFTAHCCLQGDHSPDNVKFPDGSRHSSAALGMLSVTHIMSVLVLLSVVGVGIQQYMIRNHILNI